MYHKESITKIKKREKILMEKEERISNRKNEPKNEEYNKIRLTKLKKDKRKKNIKEKKI